MGWKKLKLRWDWKSPICIVCKESIRNHHFEFFWHTVAKKARHIGCGEPTDAELYQNVFKRNRPMPDPEPSTGSGIYDENGRDLADSKN